MKKKIQLLTIAVNILFVLSSYGQVWKWAKGSINPTRVIESWPIAVDAAGNIYESGMVWDFSSTYTTSTVSWGSSSILSPFIDHVVIVSSDSNGGYRWIKTTTGASAFMINLAADACGYVYLYGMYNPGTLTLGTASVTNPFSSAEMYFLAKIDGNGNTIWLKNIGRQSNTLTNAYAGGMSINKYASEIYVSGVFNGASTNIGTTTLTNTSPDTNTCDIFIAKYNSLGTPAWAASFGGDSVESISSIAAANNGDVYIGGSYYSDTVIVGPDTLTNPSTTKQHLFLAKFDKFGNPRWSRSSTGHYFDNIFGMTADNWNNVYLVGSYKDTLSFGAVTLPYLYLPHTHNFILKFDSSGAAKWGRSLTGTAPYRINGYGVAADNNGKIWMCGGANTGAVSTPEPMFIAEFDTLGTLLDSTSKNSGGDDQSAITVDNRGNLYIGGDYVYTPFVVGSDTLNLIGSSGESIFIAKYKYPFVSAVLDTLPPITICQGSATSVIVNFPCGKWLSGNPLVATVDTSTGIITGVAPGTAIITYQGGSIGYETVRVNVLPGPGAIVGPHHICIGTPATFSNTVSGGSWSIFPSAIASVSASGVVTPLFSGTAILSYTLANGCYATDSIIIHLHLPAIFGANAICTGENTTYSDSVAGGSWSSSNPSVTTISGVGILHGLTPGTSVIVYTTGTCFVIKNITINPTPSTIAGFDTICVGDTVHFTDALPGGVWSSSNASVSAVDSAGNVTGISAGTVVITYTSNRGCSVADTVHIIDCSTSEVVDIDRNIKMFPIPAHENLQISAPSIIKSVEIIDCFGRTVFRRNFYTSNITIPIIDLVSGVFFARINNVVVKRFTKY